MNKTSSVGIWIAIAALLVNMPRFVILFLDVDGIDLGLVAEGWLLGIGGVAMGVALSGGGAYIAHTIAQPKPRPGVATFALIACWIALLIFSVILLAPSLVLAVRTYGLSKVLHTENQQWAWSVAAVIAVEVLAGGAMVAHAVSGADVAHQPKRKGAFAKLLDAASDAAIAKLAQSSAQQNASANTHATQSATQPETQKTAEDTPTISLPSTVIEAYNMRQNNLPIADIAQRIGKSERTVNNYLKQARAQLNGHSKAEAHT